MNAPQFPALDAAEAQPIDPAPLTAKMAAHAWRGQCLAAFARAEGAVTRALFALAPAEQRLGECHLVGTRFDTLEQLLHAKGAAAKNAGKAVRAYRPWHPLRTFLCHGEATVTGTAAGAWTATFRLVGFAGDRLRYDLLTLTAAQGEAERQALHRATDGLVSLLTPYRGEETAFDRIAMTGALSR